MTSNEAIQMFGKSPLTVACGLVCIGGATKAANAARGMAKFYAAQHSKTAADLAAFWCSVLRYVLGGSRGPRISNPFQLASMQHVIDRFNPGEELTCSTSL